MQDLRKLCSSLQSDLESTQIKLNLYEETGKKREEHLKNLLETLKKRDEDVTRLTMELRRIEDLNTSLRAEIRQVAIVVEAETSSRFVRELELTRKFAAAKEEETRIAVNLVNSYQHQGDIPSFRKTQFPKSKEVSPIRSGSKWRNSRTEDLSIRKSTENRTLVYSNQK